MIRVCAALPLAGRSDGACWKRAPSRNGSSRRRSKHRLSCSSTPPIPTDFGIFKYLAARVARSPLKVRQDVLYLDVFRGQVRRGSELLHVSDRGLELLVALAASVGNARKEELAGAIWPGLDGDAALNALKCACRARACRSPTRDVSPEHEARIRARRTVAIDVREFEKLLRSTRGVDVFSDAIRRQVQEAAGALGTRERSYASGWRWFVPQALHLDELQSELALKLAKDAARRHDPTEAYQAAGT